MLFRSQASSGVAVSEVVAEIDRAVALAPFDSVVIGGAAQAMTRIGLRERALGYALSAARLAYLDPAR